MKRGPVMDLRGRWTEGSERMGEHGQEWKKEEGKKWRDGFM